MTMTKNGPKQAKPRVLYMTKVHPYPPAVTGDAVYSRGLIEAWSRAADLTVICAGNGSVGSEGAASADWRIVGPQRAGRARSLLSPWPLISWKGATPDYRDELRRALQTADWDVAVLDNIGSAHALPILKKYRKSKPGVKIVYVSHEWEYEARKGKYQSYQMHLPKRAVAQLDLMKVKRWEEALIRECDIVTVINTSDLIPFRTIDPSRKYLPITPGYDGRIVNFRHITRDVPRRVLMLGGRRSEQKQQVLLDWLAAAYRRLTAAGIEMVVAGDIEDNLRQRIGQQYPEVQITGYVEALDPIVQGARAGVIADMVGGGFKLRLLTQVFNRLPIVGLDSAVSGLPTPAGKGYLAAKSLDELAAMTCEIIDDVDLLDSLQNRAFADCERSFSWQERIKALTSALCAGNAAPLM